MPPIDLLTDQLAAVNARLWTIEDATSRVRARRRLRAALRRARAIGVLRKRYARGDQTRHQHARRLGPGRGEELCVNRLSPEWRNSVLSAHTVRKAVSASAGAAECSRIPIVDPRRQMTFASRTSDVSSICTANWGGSAMSRASARRRPSRDRSQIRPSQRKR